MHGQIRKNSGPKGLVIAVEPDRDNVAAIRKNIEANGLANVRIVQKGVWSKEDVLKFWLYPDPSGHSFVNVEPHSIGSVQVPIDTVDNILRELHVKKVDFIKVNVEGAEIEALKGMTDTLRGDDVELAIGAHHVIDGKESHTFVPPLLKKAGYKVRVKWKTVYAWKKTRQSEPH